MGKKKRFQRNENKKEIENTYEESGNVKQGRNSSGTKGIDRSHALVQEVLNVASQIVPSQMDTVNKVVDAAIVFARTHKTPVTPNDEKNTYQTSDAGSIVATVKEIAGRIRHEENSSQDVAVALKKIGEIMTREEILAAFSHQDLPADPWKEAGSIALASTYETPLTSTEVFDKKDEYAKYEALEDHQDKITAKQIKQEKSRKKEKTKKTSIEPEYSSDSDPKPKSNTGSDPKPKSNTGSATTDQVNTLKEIIFFGKMYLIHFLIIILLASITSYGLLIGIITNLLFPVFLLIVDLLIYRFVRKW